MKESDQIDEVSRMIEQGEFGVDRIRQLIQTLDAKGHGAVLRRTIHDLDRSPIESISVEDTQDDLELATIVGNSLKPSGIEGPAVTGPIDSLNSGSAEWGHNHQVQSAQVDESIIIHAAPDADVGQVSSLPAKFEQIQELARGGVGVINVVSDRELLRTLVMKTLIDGSEATEYVLKKFVEEAQITAQLEHPNIVPVHEFGRFTGGEVFFTMKLVQGRTLKDVLRKLRKGDAATQEQFGRTRLISIFQSVCQAIAFAHSRQVIHRDIKPANIMTGEYGEVLVLDWGVAKVLGTDESLSGMEESVRTDRSTSGDATMMGLIAGTPSYMPPEQAAGRVDRLDERSDVYALGALLYEILTLRPPFHKKTHRETLKSVITDPLVPPTVRAPQQNIPASLEDICLGCLHKKPRERYQSVGEVISALNQYLAGIEDLDRRVRLSEERLEEGLVQIADYHTVRSKAMECRDRLLDLEWEIPSHADATDKRRLWDCQGQHVDTDARMHQAFGTAVTTMVEAVGFNPDNVEACNELARLYWYALRDSEHDGDSRAAGRYRTLVATYDRGLYTEQLRGDGRLNLRSRPTGARVSAARYLDEDRRRVTGDPVDLGQTALKAEILGDGDWLLTLRAPGFRDIKLPVKVDRAEVLDVNCRFFTDQEIGEHYLQIPAGSFIAGGDPACASARLRRVEELGDFFVARYPVTCAEYLAFIRDLDRVDPEAAANRVPRTRADGGQLWDRAEGKFSWPTVDRHGYRWAAHWPVFGVSFDDAEAYTSWYTRRTKVPVRLPTEVEWEKAARGTDGRWYPWGEHFDASFCKMARSLAGSPMPEMVGTYRTDCSPYGVFDMAGLIREYCDSRFDADETLRVVRGGSYLATGDVSCRTTHRQAVLRHVPALDHGFRVVRDAPADPAAETPRLVRPKF